LPFFQTFDRQNSAGIPTALHIITNTLHSVKQIRLRKR
jgi:hypothetical protein